MVLAIRGRNEDPSLYLPVDDDGNQCFFEFVGGKGRCLISRPGEQSLESRLTVLTTEAINEGASLDAGFSNICLCGPGPAQPDENQAIQ